MKQSKKERYWIEAASPATKVHNLLIRKGETEGLYQCFYNKDPAYRQHLQVFREKGFITKKMGKEIKSKLKDRGQVCTLFRYARNHTGNIYRVKNDSKGEVQVTQDVVWTKGRKENNNDDKPEKEEEHEHEIVSKSDDEAQPEMPLFKEAKGCISREV